MKEGGRKREKRRDAKGTKTPKMQSSKEQGGEGGEGRLRMLFTAVAAAAAGRDRKCDKSPRLKQTSGGRKDSIHGREPTDARSEPRGREKNGLRLACAWEVVQKLLLSGVNKTLLGKKTGYEPRENSSRVTIPFSSKKNGPIFQNSAKYRPPSHKLQRRPRMNRQMQWKKALATRINILLITEKYHF